MGHCNPLTDDQLRRMMAGQTTYQPERTDLDREAERAAVQHFGTVLAYLCAGRKGVAFTKGFTDARRGFVWITGADADFMDHYRRGVVCAG